MVTLQDFIHALETLNLFVKDNKTHSVRLTTVKVLFERQHRGDFIHRLKGYSGKGKNVLSSNKETLYGYLRTSFLFRVFNQIVAYQELFCKIMLLVSSSCNDIDDRNKKLNIIIIIIKELL